MPRTSASMFLLALLGCTATGSKDTDTADSVGENEAPRLTVDAPLGGAEFEPGEQVLVSGFVVDDSDSAEALLVTVLTDDSEIVSTAVDEDGNFAQVLSLQTGSHTLTVTATDSAGASSTVERVVTMLDEGTDDPPTTPVIHIEPSDPVTGSGLVVVIDTPSEDPDGYSVQTSISWTVDGEERSSEAEIVEGETWRGETWTVTVRGNDGTLDGDAATASVTIGNAPPEASGAEIGPDGAIVGEALQCSVLDVTDPEGDAVTETYAWTVGGVAAGDGTATLAGGLALLGQDVVCAVTLDDGTDTATIVSDVFQIGNSAPGAPTVEITPADPADTDDLSCTITVEAVDPDGDVLTTSYAWFADGVATGETSAILSADLTHRDEAWTCEVTVTDPGGLTNGASASATIGLAWEGLESAADADATIDGVTASGAFGKSVALLGDVDGDGLSELLVGANGENASAGAMYLFAGATLSGALTTADAAASWGGAYDEGQLGGYRAVAAVGDHDADGAADVLFAAPDADANGLGSGEAYLFYGGGSWGIDGSASDADWTVAGSAADQTGARLASGDLDGDGWLDLVVAAPGASDSGRTAGTVAIYPGDGGRFSGAAALTDAEWRIYGDNELDGLGWTTKTVGDVDGDGYDDLFVAALYADPGGSESGQGALVAGGSAARSSNTVSSHAAATFSGDAAGDRFGYDAVGDIDLDEDGVGDLLIAEYQDDTAATDGGAVHVFLGRSGWATEYMPGDGDARIDGDDASARFGHVMAAPGDLDSDGVEDLVIGALFASPTGLSYQGGAHVLLGPDWAVPALSSEVAWQSHGEAESDLYGDALGFGRADIDGDGRSDFAVGAQGHDAGADGAGRVYVWRGR